MCSVLNICEDQVRNLLQWEKAFEAVECALEGVANGNAFQNLSSRTPLGPTKNFMVAMPGYLINKKYGAIAYKVFTVFPSNANSTNTQISLIDEKEGVLKAIIYGNDITEWRTAAASVIATKYLHGLTSGKPNKTLAICGAGNQGRTHAIALQHYFNFDEVRIWNRTSKRAQDLVSELNTDSKKSVYVACDTVENCLKNADVIVTATAGVEVIVKLEWVKKGAHINAIAVNSTNFELDKATYKAGDVYVDSLNNANVQLTHIQALGVEFKGQIGDLITGSITTPDANAITIFQSLGMAVEDCAMARMIYDLYKAKSR